MISHNFCYSTLCSYHDIRDLKEGIDYIKTPNNCYFIKPEKRKGILPDILQNLLNARKVAKKLLKEAKNNLNEAKK